MPAIFFRLQNMLSRQQLVIATIFFLGLLACFLLYMPGLHGPFVFDDWGSLPALAGFGNGVHADISFWWYVFGNTTGPLGRPLSMLSFLINDNGWPSDPYYFKYTNVLVHMLNGALVFAVARALLARMKLPALRVEIIALCTALIWLLHPIHTATILQVVQRMTLLSSLFMLFGVLCYLNGCQKLEQGKVKSAWLLLIPCIVLCGLLAILCKETGALLPIYLLVLHLTLAPMPCHRGTRYWAALFLWVPLVILLMYVSLRWQDIRASYSLRPFTLEQRLLTEPRVIVEYLRQIALPNYLARGLFFDGYPASTNWQSPWTTLPCIFFVLASAGTAVAMRKTKPVFAFAILWFLAGHLIESTVFSLELFFLHRNYLAMIGLIFAIVLTMLRKLSHYVPMLSLIAAYTSLLTWQTAAASDVWSSEIKLGATWVAQQPRSQRAHQLLARAWYDRGRPDLAASALAQSMSLPDTFASTAIQWIFARCASGKAQQDDWNQVLPALASSGFDTAAPDALNKLRPLVGVCPAVTSESIESAVDSLLSSKKNMDSAVFASSIWRVKAEVAVDNHDLNSAISALENSYAAQKSISTAVRAAELLYSAGLDTDAQRFVRLANQTPEPTPWLRWLDIRPVVK